jgi:hypothetical protein
MRGPCNNAGKEAWTPTNKLVLTLFRGFRITGSCKVRRENLADHTILLMSSPLFNGFGPWFIAGVDSGKIRSMTANVDGTPPVAHLVALLTLMRHRRTQSLVK